MVFILGIAGTQPINPLFQPAGPKFIELLKQKKVAKPNKIKLKEFPGKPKIQFL